MFVNTFRAIMKRKIKRFLVALGIIILSIFPIAYGAYFLLGDKIEALIIKEVNSYLDVKVKVGKQEMVVFETFPNMSLKFSNVVIPESANLTGKPLLEAQEIFFVVNLWDILKGNYKVSEVKASDMVLRLYQAKNGVVNYDIIKENEDTTSGSAIQLNKITLKHAKVSYTDITIFHQYEIDFEEIDASGKIEGDLTDFLLETEALVEKVEIKGQNYVVARPISLSGMVSYNSKASTTMLKNMLLSISGSEFETEGIFAATEKGTQTDLSIKSSNNNLKSFISLLPATVSQKMAEYNTEGNFSFDFALSGNTSDKNYPVVKAGVLLEKGLLENPDKKGKLEEMHVRASLDINGDKLLLDVADFKAKLNEQPIEGHFTLEGSENKQMVGAFKGSISLEELSNFIGSEDFTLSGVADVDLLVDGAVEDLSKYGSNGLSGSIVLKDALVKNEKEKIDWKKINGKLNFGNNTVATEGLQGVVFDSDINMSVSLHNLLPYLMGETSYVGCNGSIQSQSLSLDPFLNEQASSSEVDSTFSLPDFLDVNLKIQIGTLKVEDFTASQIGAEVTMRNSQLLIPSLAFKTADGDVAMNASLKRKQGGGFVVKLDAKGSSLDIHQLFRDLQNFGQEELTHENLKGRLSLDLKMAAFLNDYLQFDMNQLFAVADIQVSQGQLLNYKPLEAMSKFASLDDLRNIKFNDLHNHIEIADGWISIPQMGIKNTVMDIQLSGKHSFENEMDYVFKIRVSDLLATKYGWRNERKTDEVEDLGEKGMIVYLTMKGKGDDLKFSISKISMKTGVNEALNKEKKEFKDIIKEEFSTDKKPNEEEIKKEQKTIIWDE